MAQNISGNIFLTETAFEFEKRPILIIPTVKGAIYCISLSIKDEQIEF
jgi:hypothetical protein